MRYTLITSILILFFSCNKTNNIEVKKYCHCLNSYIEILETNENLASADKILFNDSLRLKGDMLIQCLGNVNFSFDTEEEKNAFFNTLSNKCANSTKKLNLTEN